MLAFILGRNRRQRDRRGKMVNGFEGKSLLGVRRQRGDVEIQVLRVSHLKDGKADFLFVY